MKLIMLVIIIGLAVTSFVEHNKAATALEETALARQQAENVAKVTVDVRSDANAAQKQLDDTAKQLADAKEAARVVTEAQTQAQQQAQQQMKEQTEAAAKQATELDDVKKKLTDAEAQLATMQTDLATAKAQTTATKDELTKLQEKTKLPPIGSAMSKKP